MHDGRIETTMEMATELEWMTREIAEALEATAATGGEYARDAERHLVRLRFSLARVEELKQRVIRTGGVFEPARLEVAVSILDLHVMRAEGFCERIKVRAPKATRKVMAPETDEQNSALDDALDYAAERAA